MNIFKLHIKGMHCRSCEILIEDALIKIPGVKKAKVNYHRGFAQIFHEGEIDLNKVTKAVENSGYSLGKEEHTLISHDPIEYQELGYAFLIAIILFLIAQSFGLFNISSQVSGQFSNLLAVFAIGLTAGVSTCMALVGGLVLGASAEFAKKHPESSALDKFKPHLFFNLGRIVTFFILGGLIGFAGSFFQLSASVLGFMMVFVGLVMLLLGSQLLEVFPILKKVSFTLPKSLNKFLGIKDRSTEDYSHTNSVIMGGLTFFLPCGFTQAMQLLAISSGSIVTGSLIMGVFSLGTAPGLLGVGGLTSWVKGKFAKIFFKTAGIIVIFLAIFNMRNGFNLMGLNLSFNKASASAENLQDPNVTLNNGIQEVHMTQLVNGYSPNNFTIKKGIPVKWIIVSENSNSCAASLISEKLNIRQSLVSGENVIEFTPQQTGTIRFSCIMGMYTGSFNVVDDIQTTQVSAAAAQPPSEPAKTGGCGCGGGSDYTVTPVQGEVSQDSNIQILNATYSPNQGVSPNQFTIKAGKPARLEIQALEDGEGCMGSVTLPGLNRKVEIFTKGQAASFDFTAPQSGTFQITCAMGVPHGQIKVESI